MKKRIGELMEDRNLEGEDVPCEPIRPGGIQKMMKALGIKAPSSPDPTEPLPFRRLTDEEAKALYAADRNWFEQAEAALATKH